MDMRGGIGWLDVFRIYGFVGWLALIGFLALLFMGYRVAMFVWWAAWNVKVTW